MSKGIDVSNCQGRIDWEAVKQNIDFAIIRIGWGGDYSSQDDPEAFRNMSECERLGIPYGVYLYSYALNVENAASEAAHALRMIKGQHLSLGVWFDMEDADHYKQKHGINVYANRQLITDICKTFCQRVKEAGYEVGIYASLDYWRNVIYSAQVEEYPIWLAQWGVSKPSLDCMIWQNSSKGQTPGIKGNVDTDILYKDIDDPFEPDLPPERTITGMPIIKKGSKGKAVQIWQSILGIWPDGMFGDDTLKMTKDYQKKHGLEVDGCVGPITWQSGINSF